MDEGAACPSQPEDGLVNNLTINKVLLNHCNSANNSMDITNDANILQNNINKSSNDINIHSNVQNKSRDHIITGLSLNFQMPSNNNAGAVKRTSALVNNQYTKKNAKPNSLYYNRSLGDNRFASLQDLEFELNDNVSLSNKPNTSEVNLNNINIGTKHSDSDINSTQVSSHKYCPPIILYNVNIKSLIDQFKNRQNKFDFKFKNLSTSKSKLFVKDPEIHSELMKQLKEKEIPSYSFTPESLKQSKAVLRGLHNQMEEGEIKNELDEKFPNYIDSVKKLVTSYSKKMNKDTGLFIVTLLPGKSIKDIIKIKYIAFQAITWEKPNSSGGIVQCKRCQDWGHVARNCNKKYVCVKCDKAHGPGECQLPKSEDTSPYCANCKDWGHTANFRGCPSYQKFLELRTKIRTKNYSNNSDKNNAPNSFISKNIPYAHHFRNNLKKDVHPRSVKSSIIEQFMIIANQILNPEPLDLESRILAFLQSFNSMSSQERHNQCISLLEDVKREYGSK